MRIDWNIIEEQYFEKEGYYCITLNTPIGVFTGETQADEIDIQYPSAFQASEICIQKALRKYAEAATNILKREIKMLEGMIQQACDFAGGRRDEIDNNSFRIMNGTLKQKKKELVLWQKKIEVCTENIIRRIQSRDRIVAQYVTKKDKTK